MRKRSHTHAHTLTCLHTHTHMDGGDSGCRGKLRKEWHVFKAERANQDEAGGELEAAGGTGTAAGSLAFTDSSRRAEPAHVCSTGPCGTPGHFSSAHLGDLPRVWKRSQTPAKGLRNALFSFRFP